MKILLVVGRDYFSRKITSSFASGKKLVIIQDKSCTLRKILKIILKNRISILLILKMLICELRRNKNILRNNKLELIKNNNDLFFYIKKYKPKKIILFRVGLVIQKKVISFGVPIFNIHCAMLPKYKGLGAIHKAINQKAVMQKATLHKVTYKIDSGKILDTEPYKINLKKSYCFNENQAYNAGIKLLKRSILS